MKVSGKIKRIIWKMTPRPLISGYHLFLVFTGAVFYRFPSRQLKVIGVTGTSGKSTVVELLAQVLNYAGHQVASSSSIQFRLKDKTLRNNLKMTMPGRWAIQRFLFQAKKMGCHYAILEVTSEGISQHRHRFIDFDALVFTNLSPEHIERHGGFENYKQTKGRLFASLAKSRKSNKTILVNTDSQQADYFLSFKADRKIGFGREDHGKTQEGVFLESISLNASGASFGFAGQKVKWPLLGEFNVMNGLAVAATARSQGLAVKQIAEALSSVKSMPGRMEVVIDHPFSAIVDYAHTPKALKSVYETVRNGLKGKMIVVLGSCGGGRDKWKRPIFGRLAGEYAQVVILTNEDPYDENPASIIEQIKAGVSAEFKGKLFIVIDREKAIKKALCLAQPNDAVVVTGKGSESVICWANGHKTEWDDREVVKKIWQEIKPS